MKKESIQTRETHALYFEVAPGVWGTRDVFVNMYMIRNEADDSWVLVDTGLKSSYLRIKKMAASLFGPDSKPSAIILTHGHFDHVGSLKRLAEEWQVPVYCHYMELPYLSGRSSYPPPDPSVGGGLMASMSWIYPRKPINVEPHLHILPPDGRVPNLHEWVYIFTPGHAPGHISLFRGRDKVLIAGDAFVTTCQESVLSVMKQSKKLSGPPKYFTYDWEAAYHSVRNLAALQPSIVATGHGRPMEGNEMREALSNLVANFHELAVPKQGRYVDDAAVADMNGLMYVPPKHSASAKSKLLGLAVFVAAASLTYLLKTDTRRQKRSWF